MKSKHSRRAHPLEPCGASQRLLGKNYGLANSKKLWSFRNRLYLFKYINACWLNQFLTSYFQSGGNMNETMHKWLETAFSWIMNQTMGLERVPACEEIKKFAYNFMKSKRLINMTEDDIKRDTYFSEQLNDQLYELFSTCVQIDPLRKEKLDSSYGCGLLHFENAERKLDVLTHFFKWYHSIKKKSYLKSDDYDRLIELVNEYEKEQGWVNEETDDYYDEADNYDEMYAFPPSVIAEKMINDIIKNQETLKHWMETTKFRVSEKQITNFINDYWKGQDSDNEDDNCSSSDEMDYLLNGMDKDSDDDKEDSDDDKDNKDDDGDIFSMNDNSNRESNPLYARNFRRGIKLCNFNCYIFTYIYIFVHMPIYINIFVHISTYTHTYSYTAPADRKSVV